MAENAKKQEQPPKKAQKAATYRMEELIKASEKALGVPKECAVAALKRSGKEEMTVGEAKAAVERFMKQEVK